MEIEVVQGDPMEAEAGEGDPVGDDDGRSNTDLSGRSGDVDSDSESKWKSWRKSLFWYENPELRDGPDYDVLPYPWEEEEEWKGKDKDGEEGRGRDKEEGGALFLKVTGTTWSELSDERRKRGRWEEHPGMVSSRTTSAAAAASSSCPEGVADAQQQPLCTSAEVIKVRMEMHECYEKGTSYDCLFESKANRDELFFHNDYDEPYMIYVIRCQRELRVPPYAHVFPGLNDTVLLCDFVKFGLPVYNILACYQCLI